MTTREYAAGLRKIADFLDSRPEFETDIAPSLSLYYYHKEKFIVAAKALGSATKIFSDGDYAMLRLTAKDAPVTLGIQRDKVCKKTVTYDCEPLFSPEEVAEILATPEVPL
jgi:hypothetical protein